MKQSKFHLSFLRDDFVKHIIFRRDRLLIGSLGFICVHAFSWSKSGGRQTEKKADWCSPWKSAYGWRFCSAQKGEVPSGNPAFAAPGWTSGGAPQPWSPTRPSSNCWAPVKGVILQGPHRIPWEGRSSKQPPQLCRQILSAWSLAFECCVLWALLTICVILTFSTFGDYRDHKHEICSLDKQKIFNA